MAPLGWEEKREGAAEQVAMSVFVNRGHPEQSECSVTLETVLSRVQGTGQQPPVRSPRSGSVTVLSVATFSDDSSHVKSDILNAGLIIVICFHLKWKTCSLEVLE